MSRFYFISIIVLLFSTTPLYAAKVAENTYDEDTVFVALLNECVDAFPSSLVKNIEQTEQLLRITAVDGSTYEYNWQHIEYYGKEAPDFPRFTSFKFNNKFNDDVYSDIDCSINDNGSITATVPSIGRRLTPSFQLSNDVAVAYVNGVRQVSKKSRHRFDKTINYLVCHPGHRILSLDKADEPEPEPVDPIDPSDEIIEPVNLTAGMFSTNAPSNHGEDPVNLLDGNLNTIFHSTWGTGVYEKLPADSCPYLDIHLPEPLHHLQFSYTNRPAEGRHTTGLRLYASNDGKVWTVVRDFDVDADKLPTTAAGVYHSPTVDLGNDYTFLRIEQTSSYYHNNYIQWSEFALWKVTFPEPEETGGETGGDSGGEGGESEEDSIPLKWVPLGRKYAVVLDWPIESAVMTPRIDIDIEDGKMVSSKTDYLNAAITIDGGGVFPGLTDSVQIKGRGNSSWNGSNPYAKNPYRLKFDHKVKPLGLKNAKSWVLQANAINGSMLCNAIGMKVARLVGAAGANHVIPVELYMNGNYRGSYIFTEKIGFANNSIDIDDESAATMLELDSYFDETYKFRDNAYSLPVNIKEPGFSEPSSTRLTMDAIISDFSRFTDAVKNKEDISYYCDVDAFAAFYLTNDLVENIELMHPKSTYLYKENIHSSLSKYTFGPVWDLDWGFGYENYHSYFPSETDATITEAHSMEKNQFWRDLRQCGEPLDRAYYKAWKNFMENGLEELLEYCDDYYSYAKPSLQNNATKWSDGRSYDVITSNAKTWLQSRAIYLFAQLTPYDIPAEDDDYEEWIPEELPEIIETRIDAQRTNATRFDVYDIRGMLIKRGATYDNLRDGLRPGLYIVNGRKMLIP